nr:nesprin-2 isoform X2 [Nothobranchius furzeri]
MQDIVEQQLLTCQEMFLEIEAKVANLPVLGPAADHQQQSNELEAVGSQKEEADLLASRLDLLKAKLISLQRLLQDRQGEEKMISKKHPLEQTTTLLILQKLEHEISEQRKLTQAIARQSSRVRRYSQEDHSQLLPRSPPAEAAVEKSVAQKKWDHLHIRLLALEPSWLLPPAQKVTDSSMEGSDGTAGCMIGTEHLKELQTSIRLLRELGHTSAELLNQAVEGSHQPPEEEVFHALHRLFLSLSSVNKLLNWPAETNQVQDSQLGLLQSLSSEMTTLGSEFVSQGSNVSHLLGLEHGQMFLDDLSRVLAVVQSALRKSLKQLQESAEKQAALLMQEQAEQGELDTLLGGARSCWEELRGCENIQKHFDQLVQSLEQLLSLGRERLSQQPTVTVQHRADLQQQLSSHTKFFQSLGHRFHVLQVLSDRLSDGALQRSEGVMTVLQDEVDRLQQQGLVEGIRMQETLQMWSLWEEDSIWSDSALTSIETSFTKMQEGLCSEEQASENLTIYKACCRLEESEPRFSQMLESGRSLHRAGCSGVGVSILKLEARWRSLRERLERETSSSDRIKKLWSRFLRDSAELSGWIATATQLVSGWNQLDASAAKQLDGQQRRNLFFQSVALDKELKARSELKVMVIGAATQLVQLREADQDSHRKVTDEETSPTPHQDLDSISPRVREIESNWSRLVTEVSLVQKSLHKLWLEELTQQGALLELQEWVGAAESQQEERRRGIQQNICTNACLIRILNHCRECQTEMSAHRATLDHVTQPLQMFTDLYELNQVAEEEGRVVQRWIRLENDLRAQIQEVEKELRDRAQQGGRLQLIITWMSDQSLWIQSAQRPSSRPELLRSISACEDLEEHIRQKSADLQELRNRCCGPKENSQNHFVRQTEKCIQACAALTQQNELAKQKLLKTQQLWSSMETKRTQVMLNRIRTSQMLGYHSHPPLSLQAHRRLHDKLQVLLEETEASGSDWDELSQTMFHLGGNISPAAAGVLSEQLERERDGWDQVLAALIQQLQRSREVLQVWEDFTQLVASLSGHLQTLQRDATSELSILPRQGDPVDEVNIRITTAESLLNTTNTLQSDLDVVLQASRSLANHLEPSAAILVQSESRLLSGGVLQLRQQLRWRLGQLQEELKLLQETERDLESLERSLEVWQQRLQNAALTPQSGVLELSGLSADLDLLNESSSNLTPGGAAALRLQRLNRDWASTSARAEQACSELQTEALRRQTFEQKCESWMAFLQRMEDNLPADIAGSYVSLRKQLCTHKRFQVELAIGHQILRAVITEALQLLQEGEVEDRRDFILKLAQLKAHWQGVVQRVDQRSSSVAGLVRQWHLYGRDLRKLQRFLSDTQTHLPLEGTVRCSLQQLRHSLQDLQHTELLFQRYQSSFLHTLEVGRQLFAVGDEESQAQLQMDLGMLEEEWDNLHSLLSRRMDLTDAIIKNWERCEAGITDSMMHLKDLKTRLNQTESTDLQSHDDFHKENKDLLEDWAESLTELSTMKTDLSQYIIADDLLLLQEQVEHLHCQWEELCFKVSLRKQEIADRLNAWIIFNEKNKELCEWLTQMENKVAHNSDLNIEEMVEKLKKDCMEEINLFSENKTHLKQLGEQLITASNKAKETEVNDKLKDVNDRWQHLFDHIEARVRKLKETLVTVQQLDKNMSNLRTWLSRIEAELAKPVVYSVCHSNEIQKKLAEHQDLQRDIEQHTECVASVLTLCDVLLHDADACGSDSENDSILQTTRSLDRRWRNICAMSMERRMRIEETWRLWCKFLGDYSHFEEWLKTAERTAANPESANVLYTSAKEELKKFEAFQRQVHERLTQLELVNKQYRRLARENRTDAASKLRVMVHDGNQRWDCLQKRVASVLRRLKHFTSQREDFEGTREAILVWLTEMDLQLTNVEHFSESDFEDKMRQLKGFQQEITLNTNKIDALIVFGENLIQKSAPLDAVLIEDELEELHSYCQEVFGRVARFHHRLVNKRPVLHDDRETSDPDTDLYTSPDVSNVTSWSETKGRKEEADAAATRVVSGGQHMCHLLVPPPERSGRETPVSIDSIPLEWDHTVDVGGSSSHEDDEDVTFYSALSVKSVTDPPSWHHPGSKERKWLPGEIMEGLSPSPTSGVPLHQRGYDKLMSECNNSIASVKRVKLVLNDDEELEDSGLTRSVVSKHSRTGVTERWELQKAQTSDRSTEQDLEQWQKLNSDLCDVTSWLGRVLPELGRLQRIAPSTSIRDIEINIRKLKEMQRTFDSFKCLMISVNLSARHFLQGDSVELQELQEALSSANHSWSQACCGLESWESRLRSALLQCQDFHEALRLLLLWLSQAEDKLCAVTTDPSTSQSALLQHRATLVDLQEELRGRVRQVCSLQEITSQLLLSAAGEQSVEAKEKVHVISTKLDLLSQQVAAALLSLPGKVVSQETCSTGSELLGAGLETLGSPLLPHKDAESQRATVRQPAHKRSLEEAPPHRPLLYRLFRAAFPLQLLFLLLLVLICLAPLSDGDHSCTLSNNFARSFYPMLSYTNGPPPT